MTAASSCSASGDAGSLMSAPPAAPLASPITVSFVLVSPSTEICCAQHLSGALPRPSALLVLSLGALPVAEQAHSHVHYIRARTRHTCI